MQVKISYELLIVELCRFSRFIQTKFYTSRFGCRKKATFRSTYWTSFSLLRSHSWKCRSNYEWYVNRGDWFLNDATTENFNRKTELQTRKKALILDRKRRFCIFYRSYFVKGITIMSCLTSPLKWRGSSWFKTWSWLSKIIGQAHILRISESFQIVLIWLIAKT